MENLGINRSDSLDLTALKIHAHLNVINTFEVKNGRKHIYCFVSKEGILLRVYKNGKRTETNFINILDELE